MDVCIALWEESLDKEYIYQINTLYTLNSFRLCQVYLKDEREECTSNINSLE